MATRAGREDASSDNHGVANSNRRGRRAYRHKPARASAVSLFGFVPESREPRIIRRGGLGLADVDDIAAVGLDLDAGGIDARLARILAHAGERRLARLARLGGFWRLGCLGQLGGARGARNEKAQLRLTRVRTIFHVKT